MKASALKSAFQLQSQLHNLIMLSPEQVAQSLSSFNGCTMGLTGRVKCTVRVWLAATPQRKGLTPAFVLCSVCGEGVHTCYSAYVCICVYVPGSQPSSAGVSWTVLRFCLLVYKLHSLCVHMCTQSKDNLKELVLSFPHGGRGDQTQVVQSDSNCFTPSSRSDTGSLAAPGAWVAGQ